MSMNLTIVGATALRLLGDDTVEHKVLNGLSDLSTSTNNFRPVLHQLSIISHLTEQRLFSFPRKTRKAVLIN